LSRASPPGTVAVCAHLDRSVRNPGLPARRGRPPPYCIRLSRVLRRRPAGCGRAGPDHRGHLGCCCRPGYVAVQPPLNALAPVTTVRVPVTLAAADQRGSSGAGDPGPDWTLRCPYDAGRVRAPRLSCPRGGAARSEVIGVQARPQAPPQATPRSTSDATLAAHACSRHHISTPYPPCVDFLHPDHVGKREGMEDRAVQATPASFRPSGAARVDALPGAVRVALSRRPDGKGDRRGSWPLPLSAFVYTHPCLMHAAAIQQVSWSRRQQLVNGVLEAD